VRSRNLPAAKHGVRSSSFEWEVLKRLTAAAPFQPATNFWRAIEAAALAPLLPRKGLGLDIGCGDGSFTRTLRDLTKSEWRLVGLDVDPDEAELARSSQTYDCVHVASAEAIPEPCGSFDFALANSVLEHTPRVRDCLCEISRCVRPGGAFFVTVPSPHLHDCMRGPWAFQRASREEYLAETDVRLSHLHYWPYERWCSELRKCGFECHGLRWCLSARQVRRWEFLTNCTGGLLYRMNGRKASPLQIQRRLGLRRKLPFGVLPLAIGLAALVSRGALADECVAPEQAGDYVLVATKR